MLVFLLVIVLACGRRFVMSLVPCPILDSFKRVASRVPSDAVTTSRSLQLNMLVRHNRFDRVACSCSRAECRWRNGSDHSLAINYWLSQFKPLVNTARAPNLLILKRITMRPAHGCPSDRPRLFSRSFTYFAAVFTSPVVQLFTQQ